ncbi:hypothetical protein RS130_01945 [Paraglaciecola aquimarina]|uniref:Uncharacterized protein n=1 Tax=Paraglaciecola aquimarina TaxID=1235557 RepID=A0ABU3SS54_9ALTE|nr:hypothetical protein [Paraglaciecola aquimarina]MDU0352847.1 hypothetical protein [Paraglaciecola aquimarina]
MNFWLALISILVGCAICSPLFKYMFKAISSNAPEFDAGYKKVVKRDATEDFVSGYGSRDTTVNQFAAANFVVLLIPFIPACFIAVPIYCLLNWLYQHAI